MKNMFFRKVQRSYPKSKCVNVPKEISSLLDIDIGDVVIYAVHDGIIEIKKAKI